MPTTPRPLFTALLLLPFFASHLLAAELTVEDFCFEGPIGSPGTTVTKLGPNHFKVKLLRAPKHPEWGQMTSKPSLTHWCSGTHVQFDCTAFCCEGCGEMRTIAENKQVGETLMKSLVEFYR